MHAPLFFPLSRERLPSCVGLCLLYHGSSGAASSHPALLFSEVPSHVEYAGSYQCSETGKTEPFSQISSQKAGMLNIHVNSYLPREKLRSWGFSPCLLCAEPGAGTMVSGCVLVQTLTFVLSSAQPVAFSCQHLDSERTKTSRSGSPLKSLHVGHVSGFSSQGETRS